MNIFVLFWEYDRFRFIFLFVFLGAEFGLFFGRVGFVAPLTHPLHLANFGLKPEKHVDLLPKEVEIFCHSIHRFTFTYVTYREYKLDSIIPGRNNDPLIFPNILLRFRLLDSTVVPVGTRRNGFIIFFLYCIYIPWQ